MSALTADHAVDPREEHLGGYRRVAVTGSSGFVGTHTVEALARLGKQVVALDLRPPANHLPPGASYQQVDLRDQAALETALRGVDLVFHLAANASGGLSVVSPGLDFDINAGGTVRLAEATLAAGVQRLVYLSSACVYGTPQHWPIVEHHPTTPLLPYGASKLAGEAALRAFCSTYGLDAVIGRAFVLYGPGEDPATAGGEVSRYLRFHLNGLSVPVIGNVDHKRRDFVHVWDLVRALLALADNGRRGDVYNLGTGTDHSIRTLLQTIGDATGTTPRWHVENNDPSDSFPLVPDIEKLITLGYAPTVSLHEGVALLAQHLGQCPRLPTAETSLRENKHPTPPASEVSHA